MVDPLTAKQQSAVARARANPDLRRILFRKATGVQWYDAFVKAGFIVPSEVPRPVPAKEAGYVAIPHWLITDYLVATSPALGDSENREFAIKVLDFIREATSHARTQGFSNYRVWWQLSKVVRQLPLALLTHDDIHNFAYWLSDPYERGVVAESLGHHWLSAVLDHTDDHSLSLAQSFLSVLYEVSIVEKGQSDTAHKRLALRFDTWHGEKITKAIAAKTGQVLGIGAVNIFRERVEAMLTGLDNDRWSTIWRPAIEEHQQNRGHHDSPDILVEAFRDCLLAFISTNPDSARPYVSSMLDSSFTLIRRIAVHSIDAKYGEIGALVERVIAVTYFNSYLQHELWHLLKNRYPDFAQKDQAATLTTIESLVERDDKEKEHVVATAYRRARWLAAIRDHEQRFMELYRSYVQMARSEPEHPDFSSYTSSGWSGAETPIALEQLRAMDVPVLVRQLQAYRDPGRFMEPGLEGLTKALRQAVKAEPMRYYTKLALFADLDLAYVYAVLEAFGDAWGEKQQLVWEEIWPPVLDFCEELVHQNRFWAEENAGERQHFVANRHWIVGAMARLIESGTESDSHAFPKDLLPQAEEILKVLLDNEAGADFKTDSDAVSVAINSSRGRCLEAFIDLTLRTCRLADDEAARTSAWARFQPRYDSELALANNDQFEFATLVVNYLPNFLYMSKEWTLRNLPVIFGHDPELRWLCAMQAYAYVNTVYPDVYKYLRDSGDFAKALDDERLKKRVGEKIVQNIAIAYLIDLERLQDAHGLLRLLIERRNVDELSQLTWFFWTLRKEGDDENVRKKVLELWPQLLTSIDTDTREGKRLASRLCDWSVFVDEVDPTTKQLILTVAPYADDDYHSSELLESIARISQRQPAEAHEIWMSVLEKSQPDFPIEAVKAALTNILQMEDPGQRKAKAIVSRYIAAGNDDVQSIWKELVAAYGRNA